MWYEEANILYTHWVRSDLAHCTCIESWPGFGSGPEEEKGVRFPS